MNLAERVIGKTLILFLKRNPEELKEAKRKREWDYHIAHEIPTKSEQIQYAYLQKEFIAAACKPISPDNSSYVHVN
jgi:hypothetical protein